MLGVGEVRLGDTGLLGQFMDLCSVYEGGSIFFTAPYCDDHFIRMLRVHLQMRSFKFQVVVKDDTAAEKMMRSLVQEGSTSAEIFLSQHLHAKVYIFESPNRDLAAMIGSHNATAAGLSKNLEVGVFVSARPNKPEWKAIADLREYLRNKSHFHSSSEHRKNNSEEL